MKKRTKLRGTGVCYRRMKKEAYEFFGKPSKNQAKKGRITLFAYAGGKTGGVTKNTYTVRKAIRDFEGPDAMPRFAFWGERTCRYCGWTMRNGKYLEHARKIIKWHDGKVTCPGKKLENA